MLPCDQVQIIEVLRQMKIRHPVYVCCLNLVGCMGCLRENQNTVNIELRSLCPRDFVVFGPSRVALAAGSFFFAVE